MLISPLFFSHYPYTNKYHFFRHPTHKVPKHNDMTKQFVMMTINSCPIPADNLLRHGNALAWYSSKMNWVVTLYKKRDDLEGTRCGLIKNHFVLKKSKKPQSYQLILKSYS